MDVKGTPVHVQRKTIGFETIRGGDIVGEHTVMFAIDGERLEITHRSHTRANFAYGAMRAAPGSMGARRVCSDMNDVLGLSELDTRRIVPIA